MAAENAQNGSGKSSRKPILSLILCTRSDEYQGNSLWRLRTALNYVGQTAHQLGRQEDVEVIVSDWGSKTPLRDLLELTPEAARIVSFMLIPPDIAKVEQKDSPFPEVLALNAAARRANGEYIGRIDQDTLVGKHFLKTFFWLHEKPRLLTPLKNAMMLSNRRRISVRFTSHSPSFWAVDRFVRWFGRSLPSMNPLPPHLFYQSYVGIWLLHRDLWYECGGLDERFIYMDWMEVDMILRLTPKYTLVNLGELTDLDLYHLDHGPARVEWSAQRNRKQNPIRDLDNLPDEVHPNGENWGLIQYPLEVLPYSLDKASARETTLDRWSWRNWLGLMYVLLISGALIVWDHLIIGAVRLWNKLIHILAPIWWFFFASSTWRNRARVARETVSGQPLHSWPRLLVARWMERRSYQS
jgi:hypothetical protein